MYRQGACGYTCGDTSRPAIHPIQAMITSSPRTSSAFRAWAAVLAAASVLLAFQLLHPAGLAGPVPWGCAMLAGSVVLVFADILVALFVVALPLALLIATVAGPMLR
jgi:hypothetical protein